MIIGAGPAGEAAAFKARERGASVAIVDRQWFGGSCPHIGCLPSKALLHSAARHAANPATYSWAARLGPPRLHGQPPGRRRRAGRLGPRQARSRRPARSPTAGPPGSSDAAGSRSATTTRSMSCSGRERHRRGRLRLEGAAGARARRHRDVDEPRGDAGPRAAEEPARPRRRPDRLRDGPGLRPVRRPDDDRPVGRPAHADRPSAQLRGGRGGAAGIRRRRPARRPGRRAPGPAPARTAPTSSTSTTARPPRATRSCSPSGATFPLDDLGLEHYGIDTTGRTPRLPARRPAADRRRAVGHRRPGRSRAPHPPGPLPGRARRPDGARRGRRARLPGAAAGDLHRPRGRVRRR